MTEIIAFGVKRKVIGLILVSLSIFGNVANVQNSPGANVTQNITNPQPKPFILESNLLSINVPGGGKYRTTFSFRIKNYYKNHTEMNMKYPNLTSSPEFIRGKSGSNTQDAETFDFKVVFTTTQQVQDSDFSFEVRNI
jgi:hypothetical protein